MGKKIEPSAEQIYRANKKKVKIYTILGPVTWYVFLALALCFLGLALKNSVGNVLNIIERLDKEIYTAAEIRQNYTDLAQRWGEWEIVGEENSVFTIRYINVANAMFSGVMKTFFALTIVALIVAILFGKIVFPALKKMHTINNEELVDLATLKSATQIDQLTAQTNSRKSGKEWF